MARPKEFEEQDVLEKALGVFLEKGYAEASMCDLVGAMGIGRASLYGTFGNKHDLFLAALDLYEHGVEENFLKPLERPGSPLGRLRELLETVASSQCEDGAATCLAVKAAVAGNKADAAVRERVQRITSRIDGAFENLLERARSSGEIAADADVPTLARYFTHGLQSLGVSAAIRRDEAVMKGIVDAILSAV